MTAERRLSDRPSNWSVRIASAEAVTPLPLTHGTRRMSELLSSWGQFAEKHEQNQHLNPFSGAWRGPGGRLSPNKNDSTYGRPVEGSLTEARGLAAVAKLDVEIAYMCTIIEDLGDVCADKTRIMITFGRLFAAYVRISNKLVGMLLRARRRGLVDFPGEMLFQGRDEDVVIELFLPCHHLTGLNGTSTSAAGTSSVGGDSSRGGSSSSCTPASLQGASSPSGSSCVSADLDNTSCFNAE